MKICSKCKEEKELTEFHKDAKSSDGLYSQCKECKKEYFKSRSYKEAQRRYNLSAKGKASKKARKERHITRHPEKNQAQKAVSDAIRNNKLLHANRFLCVECANVANEYHHHKGYEKENWLDVIPVCKKCHTNLHRIR